MMRALEILLRAGAVAALASLVAQFGFPLSERAEAVLHGVDLAVVAVFLVRVFARLATAADRRAHLARNWLEFALIAFLAAEMATVYAATGGTALARLYIVGAQVYLVAGMGLAAVRTNTRATMRGLRPPWVLVGSFVVLIAFGTLLLLLPHHKQGFLRRLQNYLGKHFPPLLLRLRDWESGQRPLGRHY